MSRPFPEFLKDKSKKQTIPLKLRRLVLDSIERYQEILNAWDYTGKIKYQEEDAEGLAAHIETDRRYLSFIIFIYPLAIKNWKESGDEYMEELMAHEMSHLLTNGVTDLLLSLYKTDKEVTDERESLTEKISRLVVRIDKFKKKKK